jgi:hypothetical protein
LAQQVLCVPVICLVIWKKKNVSCITFQRKSIADLCGALEHVVCIDLEWNGSGSQEPSDSFRARRGGQTASVLAAAVRVC